MQLIGHGFSCTCHIISTRTRQTESLKLLRKNMPQSLKCLICLGLRPLLCHWQKCGRPAALATLTSLLKLFARNDVPVQPTTIAHSNYFLQRLNNVPDRNGQSCSRQLLPGRAGLVAPEPCARLAARVAHSAGKPQPHPWGRALPPLCARLRQPAEKVATNREAQP
ncbi:uncharacterized protein BKA78DRAFT_112027 [Phyllosticta capitalensis]|uniref:uncharacterized protein n=1 Tax=Phyllosticta capitalensis TaxID=121624 RepID=UPI003130165C